MALAGEFEVGSVETLQGSVEAVLSIRPAPEPAPGEVVINVRGVSFADLVGLRALVQCCQRLGKSAQVEVWGVSPTIQRVLDLADMSPPRGGGDKASGRSA
jgi:anti-anti-sigma factor